MTPQPESFLHHPLILMVFSFLYNLLVVTIIARGIYYTHNRSNTYLFSYIQISVIVFFICYTLRSYELGLGMALGLFALFGILRYRTDPLPIKEMTYLFLVIGVSVVNAISSQLSEWPQLLFANVAIIASTFVLENLWAGQSEIWKSIVYEKIDLIRPENTAALKADLESRTGLDISRIEIGNIDFMRDSAQLRILCRSKKPPKPPIT